MTLRYFVLLGILGLLPWLLWRNQWPMLVVEQLDHCPIVMCDFQRHYLPQAEILLDDPNQIVRGWFYPPLLAIGLLPFVWSGHALWLWGGMLLLGLSLLTWLSLTSKHEINHFWVRSLVCGFKPSGAAWPQVGTN